MRGTLLSTLEGPGWRLVVSKPPGINTPLQKGFRVPQNVQDTPASQDDEEHQPADRNKTGIALINGPLTALITGVCAIIAAAITVFGPHLWSSNSPKPVAKPAPVSREPASSATKAASAPSGSAPAPPANRIPSAPATQPAPVRRTLTSAGSGPCQDDVTTASTKIHALPASAKVSDQVLAKGATVNGTCNYYSVSEGFYMQVTYTWPGSTASHGYIWMGDLLHAGQRHCYRANYKGVVGYSTYSLDTAACPTASGNEAPA